MCSNTFHLRFTSLSKQVGRGKTNGRKAVVADYKALAETILELVGGEENVTSVGHCATRLRLVLKDEAKAKTAELKSTKGVIDVVQAGGQYQVVIGPAVADVCIAVQGLGHFGVAEVVEDEDEQKKGIAAVLDVIAGIFFPIVPAMVGGGMLKAIMAILVAVGVLTREMSTFKMLNFMGDACFYFMPVLIGVSAAEKFKVNKYVAGALGGMLISPTFISMVAAAREAGTGIALFGIPVQLVSYASSVIPIILTVWLQSYVEPFVRKHCFEAGRMIFVPMITTLVCGIAAFCALGPIGMWVGNGLGAFFDLLNNYVPWLVPTLMGAFTPLLVMCGMHYGIIPMGIQQLAATGVDTIAGPGMLVSNVAQGGSSLAVALKAKGADLKSLAASCSLTAVLGITEPALYGVNMPYKTPLIGAMAGGGVAGLFLGIMKVGRFAQVAPGLLALPSYINPEDPTNMHALICACIACAIAFAIAFAVTFVMGIEEKGK